MPNNSVQNRKFRGRYMSATVTYEEAVRGVIQRRFAPFKGAAKLLARASGASPRTCEHWLAGSHAPNGEKLLNLMAACEELADEVNRLVAERRAARGGE